MIFSECSLLGKFTVKPFDKNFLAIVYYCIIMLAGQSFRFCADFIAACWIR